MKKIIILVFIFILVGLIIGYRKIDYAEKDLAKVSMLENFKIAIPNNVSEASFIMGYAKEHGFFEKEGLDFEIILVDQAPYQAVAGGQVDAVYGGMTRPMTLYLNDAEPRLLMTIFNTFDNNIISRYPQNQAAQIKRVAVNAAGGEGKQMIDFVLRNLGLDPEKIEHITTPSVPARMAMLEKGDVDLAMIPSTQTMNIINESGKYYQLNQNLLNENSIFLRGILSSKEIIEKNPVKMQKFITGMQKAILAEQENKDEALLYINKNLNLKDEEAKQFYEDFLNSRDGFPFTPEVNDEMRAIAEVNRAETTNPQRDLKDFIYPEFSLKAENQK